MSSVTDVDLDNSIFFKFNWINLSRSGLHFVGWLVNGKTKNHYLQKNSATREKYLVIDLLYNKLHLNINLSIFCFLDFSLVKKYT